MDSHKNHIHLFGNPEENFYILGRRDKDSFEQIYQQISMLCARNNYIAKAIKLSTDLAFKIIAHETSHYNRELKAYAEGLERPLSDLHFSFILPELVASFNKWMPDLMGLIPGCSSLFLPGDNSKDIIHHRILDYALAGAFDNNERSILYEFKNQNKVLSFSTSGLPLPSVTGMNDKGLSLALHYKHGNRFNIEGRSIFLLTADILNYCSDIKESIKYIKDQKSMAHWGIYLSDANGTVACIDIDGDEIYQEKFLMEDHPYLYFNNLPLVKKQALKDLQPYGTEEQCLMRKQIIKTRFENHIEDHSTININEGLKLLSSANQHKAKHARDWKLSPVTISSIQALSMHPGKAEALFITGKTPKFYHQETIHYQNIFSNMKIKTSKAKGKENSYHRGMHAMSAFQSAYDKGDISLAYHKLQMAIQLLKNYPEEFICKFYFYVIQYIHEVDKRDLTYLYHDFAALENLLPQYLEDHRKLFLLRLSKLIGHPCLVSSNKIKNKYLKIRFHEEEKLNWLGLKALRHLIFPRIEILDIIYSY